MKLQLRLRFSRVIPPALLFALLSSLIVSGSSVPSVSYVARKDFLLPNGSFPVGLAEGDFNKDGNADLVTVDLDSNSASVFLGNGDGTFQTPVNYAVGTAPISVVVGDFNNDGNLDIAVANLGSSNSSSISVLLGNGDGTFQSQVVTNITSSQLLESGFSYSTLVAADFNGDGKLDLAVAAAPPQVGQKVITVLLGNGDGTFQSGVNYAVPGTDGDLAVGDFNGDGKPDLVTSNGTAYVLLGKGDGTFQPAITAASGVHAGPIVVADFNNDGVLDLALLGNTDVDQGLEIVFGKGDGTFGSGVTVSSSSFYQGFLATADFNGDGLPDLAVSGATVFLNNGNGTMRQTAAFQTAGPVSAGIVATDLNGDGKPDIATVANSASFVYPNVVSAALGNGDGTFQVAPVLTNSNAESVTSVVASDFNGDGNVDLAFVMPSSEGVEISQASGGGVWLGNGNNTFQPPLVFKLSNDPVAMLSADFNKDGKPDLAVVLMNNLVAVLLGKGDGTFQPEVDYNVSLGAAVATADFSGSGNLDLIVAPGNQEAGPSEPLSLLPGKGDGTFGFAISIPSNATAVGVAAADLNNDGKPDVVAVTQSGTVEVFLGEGGDTFQPEIDTALNIVPTAVATGDFNNDGKVDVAVAGTAPNSPGPGTVAVLLGNGDGTFQPEVDYSVGGRAPSISVADLNGDGIPDLVVTSGAIGAVYTLLGNGDGTFQTAAEWGVSVSGPAAVASFNKAAPPGIAVAGSGISLLLNQLPPSAVTLSTNELSFGQQFVGLASGPKAVSITNRNTSPLSILGVSITGEDPNQFSQTNNCSAALAPNASCTVNVVFTPASASAAIQNAILTIVDSVDTSPEAVALTGTGIDFQLSTLSNSATVTAGQTATYTVDFAPVGAPSNDTVNFTCSGAPAQSTCSVAPTSVTMNANTKVTVSVQTTGQSNAAPFDVRPPHMLTPYRWTPPLIFLAIGTVVWFVSRPRYRFRNAAGVAALILVMSVGFAACGGNSNSNNSGSASSTPSGTYNLKVTAADGNFSHSIILKLTVN